VCAFYVGLTGYWLLPAIRVAGFRKIV